MKITPALKSWLVEQKQVPATLTDDDVYKTKAAEALADGSLSAEQYAGLICEDSGMTISSPSPEKVFNGAHIRVKDESEKYDETRFAANHVKSGAPVLDPIYQRPVCSMSMGSKARAGVLLKHVARRSGFDVQLTEHEKALLTEVAATQAWAGSIGGEYFEHIGGPRVKALLDESGGSQGLEVTPIEFDSDVISFPLLTSELFPMVDVRAVPRGRRIEGASISTPTVAWGGSDNTEISLFSTSSMVAAIDTTIHTVDGAIEVGRDFLSDAAVNVGGILTQLIGERLASELDDVIANGNGTTQPEGIFTASGLSTVTAGGATSIGNYESLLFGIGKQYRTAPMRCAFLANDTSYQRARAIPVGASDARRIFGMDHESYTLLGRPYKIQGDIANTKIAFGAMSRYRMYRRLGLEIRFEQGGSYLARRNLALLVYRARFGGRVVDANAFAKIIDAPA